MCLIVFKKKVFKKKVKDSGPFYKETRMDRLIVEPFNTFSNLGFLVIIIFWLIKLNGVWKDYPFLSLCVMLLIVGWFGGTMYHARRNRDLWLFLDIGPIFILSVFAIIFFWAKTGLHWIYALITSLVPFVIRLYLKAHPTPLTGSLSYCVVTLPMLIPLGIFLSATGFANFIYILLALVSMIIALTFRTIDLRVSWRIGTHWLWHVFGAIAVQFIFMFIFSV